MARLRTGIVLIGPYDRRGAFVGGATVSFRSLVEFIDRSGTPYWLIDTRRFAGRLHMPANLVWTMVNVCARMPRARAVMLNVSRRGILYVGPFVCLLCSLFRVRCCVRPFGGDLDEIVACAPVWQRRIVQRTALNADALFLETRALAECYAGRVTNAVWLPNARARRRDIPTARAYRKRFVFLSQVAANKGALVLLDAASRLDASFTVDIYGPIVDRPLKSPVQESGRYRGVVPPEAVLSTLASYDVLVLPTFAAEEGYPGVIIEAFSIGMPVIATRWRAVPEIVIHGESGLLVAPHSAEELAAAIASLDQAALRAPEHRRATGVRRVRRRARSSARARRLARLKVISPHAAGACRTASSRPCARSPGSFATRSCPTSAP